MYWQFILIMMISPAHLPARVFCLRPPTQLLYLLTHPVHVKYVSLLSLFPASHRLFKARADCKSEIKAYML